MRFAWRPIRPRIAQLRDPSVLLDVSFSGEQLIQGALPHFSYSDIFGRNEIPRLARSVLNAWAFKAANPSFEIEKLKADCCMMERVATPPERILTVEKLVDLAAN